MAITLVGAETAVEVDSNATSVSVTRPAGSTSGDVAVAVMSQDDTEALSLPSGFTELISITPNNDFRVAAGYKVLGASEPSAYEFTKENNEKAVCGVAVFRGVNTTSVIDANVSPNTGDSFTPTAPSTTTTTPNAAVLAIYGHEHGGGDASDAPSGMTLVLTRGTGFSDATTGAAIGFAWELRSSVGGSGDLVFTSNDEDWWGAFSFSLMDENESPPPKTADGDLAATQAAMDGSGVAFTIITGSGQPDASRAQLGATGDNITTVYADGAVQAETAVVDGNADRLVFAAGTLTAADAIPAGVGGRKLSVEPFFSAVPTTLSAAAVRIITGSGTVEAFGAALDANGIRVGDSQGQMEAHPAQLSVSSEFKRNAGGVLSASGAAMASTSNITWRLAQALSARQASTEATTQIFTGHTASGSMQASSAGVDAGTLRGVNGSVDLQAEDAVLYMVTWLKQDRDDNVWKDLEGGHWVAKN